MKRKIIPFAIALIFSTSFFSCKSYRYSLTSFIPVFTKTGDITVNTNISSQQIGFAVSNNLGIFATNTWNNYRKPVFYTRESELQTKHKGQWSSIGFVPYLKGRDHIYISIPIGIGKGLQHVETDSRNDDHYFISYFFQQSKYITFQPTLSYLIDDKFYLSFFNRSYFSHIKAMRSDYHKALSRNPILEYTYNDQTLFSFVNHIGTNLKFNINKIDFYLELAFLLYSNPERFLHNIYDKYSIDLPPYQLNIQVGISYNFNILEKKFWKKNSKKGN